MKNGAAIISRLNKELEERRGVMDFTNLEENAREAKLDYGEAESLVRFFSFQRERQGEPPISSDYSRLCGQLSEIYPDVEFKLADHRVVDRVKKGGGGSIVERVGYVSRNIPHLGTMPYVDTDA